VTELLGRLLYRLLPPFRQRSEAQCRAALGDQLRPADVARVAEQAFIHRLWNLTDLLLAERLLHPRTYRRFGGQFPEPGRSELLAAQRRGQPVLLVSAYYGPFDLLSIFLGYNGVRAAAVYLPHANAAFDAHRRRVRARSGCELVTVDQAPARFSQILAAGGTVALIADHHASRRGLPATFLGLPTRISPSVGLLAWRYEADVIVAGIRRMNLQFQFAIEVSDVIKHAEWAGESDPVAYITARYLRALEALVRRDPTQYLWGYARWGEELAQELTGDPAA
jgi:lauroyl/myristoyl acyltransferase